MDIKGLANTTLLDYPGHVAATVYVGGCDFKCPYCYNKSLVVNPERLSSMTNDEVYDVLRSRRVALDGICVTGGEPLLQDDLCEFLYNVKSMGLDVKLDTNGYSPTELNNVIKNHLADYIAMDIKNSPKMYSKTAGIANADITKIKLSVDLLKDCDIPYEFRTTVTKELHTWEDMEEIGRWIDGARAYYLQPYVHTDDVIMPVFSSYTKAQMLELRQMLLQYVNAVELRGYER